MSKVSAIYPRQAATSQWRTHVTAARHRITSDGPSFSIATGNPPANISSRGSKELSNVSRTQINYSKRRRSIGNPVEPNADLPSSCSAKKGRKKKTEGQRTRNNSSQILWSRSGVSSFQSPSERSETPGHVSKADLDGIGQRLGEKERNEPSAKQAPATKSSQGFNQEAGFLDPEFASKDADTVGKATQSRLGRDSSKQRPIQPHPARNGPPQLKLPNILEQSSFRRRQYAFAISPRRKKIEVAGNPSKGARNVAEQKGMGLEADEATETNEGTTREQQSLVQRVKEAESLSAQRHNTPHKYFDRETLSEQRKMDVLSEARSSYPSDVDDSKPHQLGKNHRSHLEQNISSLGDNENNISSPSNSTGEVDLSPPKMDTKESTAKDQAEPHDLEASPYEAHRMTPYSINRNDGHLPFERDPGSDLDPDRFSDQPGSARKSTITDPERKIFSKLFDSLTKPPDRGPSRSVPFTRIGQRENEANAGLHNEPRERQTSLLEFEDDEEGDMFEPGKQFYDDMNSDQMSAPKGEDPDFWIRYPIELRSMAANTQMTLAKQSRERRKVTEERLAEEGKSYNPVVAQQGAELRRIEKALNRAPSDFAIWDVLESDVFPKLTILDEEQKAEVPAKDQLARQEKVTSPNSLHRHDFIRRIPSHTFQSIFLLAIRLLCRRTSYTPLATNLLARIKSHSPIAHVLGTNAQIYNEILAYNWRIHTDIAAMLSHLHEMHVAGLAMNNETLAIIDDTTLYRHRALRGDFGLGLQAIEGMIGRRADAENLQRWKRRIRRSIESTIVEKARRAENERKMRDEGAFANSDDGNHTRQGSQQLAAIA